MRTTRIIGVVSGLLLFAHAPAVSANDFGKTLDKAIHHYTFGQFAEAIAILRGATLQAVRGKVAPTMLARARVFLAASHFALGNLDQAKADLTDALKADPTVDLDAKRFAPPLVEAMRELRGSLTGVLVVVCDRPDGEIDVVGERRARCGDTLTLPIGRHKVRATLRDVRRDESVVVRVRESVTLTIKFEGKVAPDDGVSDALRRTIARENERARRRRAWGLGLAIGGGATIAMGVVFQLLAGSAQSDLAAGRSAQTATVGDGDKAAETIRTRENLSGVMFGVGGALVVGGTLLVALSKDKSTPQAASLFRGFEMAVVRDRAGALTTIVGGTWNF